MKPTHGASSKNNSLWNVKSFQGVVNDNRNGWILTMVVEDKTKRKDEEVEKLRAVVKDETRV